MDPQPQSPQPDPASVLDSLLSTSEGAAAPAAGAPRAAYCSFCWANLPANATECPDCGKSVSEMETQRQTQAAVDRGWTPPRLQQVEPEAIPAAEPELLPVAAAAAAPAAAPAPHRRPARRPSAVGAQVAGGARALVYAGAVAGVLVGAAAVGAWLGAATFPH